MSLVLCADPVVSYFSFRPKFWDPKISPWSFLDPERVPFLRGTSAVFGAGGTLRAGVLIAWILIANFARKAVSPRLGPFSPPLGGQKP